METIAGIFDSHEAAERAVQQIHSLGIPNDRIAVLTPVMSTKQVEGSVITTDTEAPGEGQALGGVVGGVMGVAGGVSLASAAASLIVPGVGPVIAAGILGAAILGAGGTAVGMAVGEALDKSLLEGLPHDDLFVYEHALRNRRSVVITFVEEEATATRVKQTFEQLGAESTDAARDKWWSEVRSDEQANYDSTGGSFQRDEKNYRRGFQAALDTRLRGNKYESAVPKLQEIYGDECSQETFRCGYQRGLEYHSRVTK